MQMERAPGERCAVEPERSWARETRTRTLVEKEEGPAGGAACSANLVPQPGPEEPFADYLEGGCYGGGSGGGGPWPWRGGVRGRTRFRGSSGLEGVNLFFSAV